MSERLVLLLGDFEGTDAAIASVLVEWAHAGLLGTVAWTNTESDGLVRPLTSVVSNGGVTSLPLFDLLTSRIWSQVTVVGVRQQSVSMLDKKRFEVETRLLEMVQNAFDAHKDLEFQSFTVSIAEQTGLVYEAFSPFWKMHILHEPVVRIDKAVAAQPMWDDHRHLLIALLAMTMSGGFVWQLGALAPDMADQVVGVHRSIRVGRAFLRVVSAGRLTDEVLAGAFPKSGPWSIPTDVPNALAVPPGTAMSDNLIQSLVQKGKFSYQNWVDPKRERPKSLNFWQGLKLFGREFGAALKGIPVTLVAKIKDDIESFVQKATFGEDASVLLKFDPRHDDFDPSNVLETIKNSQLGNTVDPISDPEPWNVLQRVSLGSVDGGGFPDGVAPPVRGASRLVYTDPMAIGPDPDDEAFGVSDFEITLLNLQQGQTQIESMAISDALTLKAHLEALRDQLNVKPVVQESLSPNAGKSGSEGASPVAAGKKLGRFRRWRLKAKERSASKRAKKLAKKNAKKGTQKKFDATLQPAPSLPSHPNEEASESAETTNQAQTLGESSNPAPVVSQVDTAAQEDESARHSPSHPSFRSSEYTPLGVFYKGERSELLTEYAEANRICDAANSSYASINGRFAKNQTCDHCGTAFDHGLLYLHEPSKKLVRVGNICARKSMPDPGGVDVVAGRLSDLERRFTEWLAKRSGSLLWRVGEAIVAGLVTARQDLARNLQILAARPELEKAAVSAQLKFGKWTRRGVMSVLLVIGAALASVVFTPFPLLIAILLVTVYFSGFIIRMLYLARDIVRAQYKFRLALDDYERAYSRARHDLEEVVRLSSMGEQFDDWQVVIRELVHLPFGREIGFATARVGIDDVTRPPAMVLGKSRPDEKQRMQLFLQARRQTIHAGWLLEILDMLKDEWKSDYENARLTTSADNILPEADNSPAGSIVGKRPLSDQDVFYPRTDFRQRVTAGDLQRALVTKKAEQVAIDLRQTALGNLLATVEVSGLGAALSGLSVEDFLAGLSLEPEGHVSFPPDLISDKYPNYRLFAPELILPAPGTLNSEAGQIQVQPGVELTAAAWRVELSAPIEPLEILKGFEGVVTESRDTQTVDENRIRRF